LPSRIVRVAAQAGTCNVEAVTSMKSLSKWLPALSWIAKMRLLPCRRANRRTCSPGPDSVDGSSTFSVGHCHAAQPEICIGTTISCTRECLRWIPPQQPLRLCQPLVGDPGVKHSCRAPCSAQHHGRRSAQCPRICLCHRR
jgi:hypothetical protein